MALNFTLHQLGLFVAVAEELHFSKAAERMHISQPPLTRQIRALESMLGIDLFVRSSRRVELTRAGQAFLIEARRVLGAAEKAAQVAVQASGTSGSVVIGCVESAIVDLLPTVLASFANVFPFTTVQVRVLHTREQEHGLLSGDLSLGILRPPTASTNDLRLSFLYGDRLVAAIPDSFEWDDSRGLAQLAEQSFVMYSRDIGESVYNAAMQTCIAEGFVPTVAWDVASTAMLMGLVAEGQGVALLPQPYTLTHHPGVRFVWLSRPEHVSGVALAWRHQDDTDPVISAIRDWAHLAARALHQGPPT
ncbi:LysR family transcriptional regulator [Acrocarpospora catenulata]|uniref:LysR family transcriptional regulator n=1 Tax=Acrocarpospora catenulata TaxID=2836182 RepID=UPI001BDA63CB|nr:LysR family transcriptional regulator [Acrocarpospora catenulata]